MSSTFPNIIDSLPTNHSDLSDEVIHASTDNNQSAAINNIENALGVNLLNVSPSLIPVAVQTSAYQAVPNSYVPVDTTSGAVTVTLPSAPLTGSRIGIKMVIQGGINKVTINTSGSDVFNKSGGGTSLSLTLVNQAVTIQYLAGLGIWYVVSDDFAMSTLDARYLNANNVKAFGAKGDGVTDDTAAIQAAFNAAAAVGGAVYFPPVGNGAYAISATINCHGASPSTALPVYAFADGTQQMCRIKCLNDIIGPLFNVSPTSGAAVHSWYFSGLYTDMTAAPSATGLYVNNVQRLVVDRCEFREGTIGLQIGAVSAANFTRLTAYNCSSAGYKYDAGTTTNSQGHNWVNCDFFMTAGATHDCNAGWLDLSGHQDQTYYSCRVQRSQNITFKLPYGFKLDGSGATAAGQSYFIACNVDAITDGNNPGTGSTGAGYWFSKITNAKMLNCWCSSLDTGRVWREPAIYIDQCTRMDIADCYISGTGIAFGNTAVSDMVHIRNNHFPNPSTSDACITFGSATPTNLYVRGNTKEKSAANWFDNYTTAVTSQSATMTDPATTYQGNGWLNVKTFGAKGDGSTDDTAAVQAAITAATAQAAVGTVFFPAGTYLCGALTVGKGVGNQMPALIGDGPEKTTISMKSGTTTGISITGGAAVGHSFRMEHIYVLANANDTATCIYIDQADLAYFNNVKTRNGLIGIDIDNCDSSTFIKIVNFNALQAGIRLGANVGGNGIPQGNTYLDCFQYVTSGTRGDVAALVEWVNGYDHIFIGLRGYRTPGIAFKCAKGLYIHCAAQTSLFGFFTDCEWDSMTTLASDDATCAAVWLENALWVKFKDCWASANPVADGNVNPAIRLKTSNLIDWDGGWISGRGVVFDSTAPACDKILFNGPKFSSANTTGMFIMPGSNPPTNMIVTNTQRDHGVTGTTVPLTNDTTKLYAALAPQSDFFGYKPRPSKAQAALYDEPDMQMVGNNSSLVTVSGTIYGFAIWLPAGLTVTSVSFFAGTTGETLGTSPHSWAGISDSSFNMQAVTADDTAGGWSANQAKTFTFGTPYTLPSDGLYYLNLMVNSGTGGTQPTLYSVVGLASLLGAGFRRTFTANTGQTTPPAVPFTLTGLSNIGQSPYRYIS